MRCKMIDKIWIIHQVLILQVQCQINEAVLVVPNDFKLYRFYTTEREKEKYPALFLYAESLLEMLPLLHACKVYVEAWPDKSALVSLQLLICLFPFDTDCPYSRDGNILISECVF